MEDGGIDHTFIDQHGLVHTHEIKPCLVCEKPGTPVSHNQKIVFWLCKICIDKYMVYFPGKGVAM